MPVHQIKDKADLTEQLKNAGGKLVVIDFFATWCGPCRNIAPVLENLSNQRSDIVFLKVDVNQCEDISTDYNVSGLPTFVFVKNGQELGSFVGANEKKLLDTISSHA